MVHAVGLRRGVCLCYGERAGGLQAALRPGAEKQSLLLIARTPRGEERSERFYGGPPTLGIPWAVHTALDFLRRVAGTSPKGIGKEEA